MPRNVRQGVVSAALFACAVAPPLLFGGAFVWATGTIASVTSATLVVVLLARPRLVRPIPYVAWLAIGLAFFTLVQAIPLPIGLVDWLNPRSPAEARATAIAAGTSTPAFATISMDPGATLEALLRAAALIPALLVGWIFAQQRRHVLVWQALAWSVVVTAVVALAHEALGLTRVYGAYEPRFSAPHPLSPLMNPNHLGAFTACGVPVMVGLALDASNRSIRLLWGLGASVAGTVTLFSLSRGAIAQLAGSVILLACWLASLRGKSRGPWITLGAIGASIALVGVYFGLGPVVTQFERGDTSKAAIALKGLRLVLDAPLTGVGRGAFSAAFARYFGTNVRYEVPENVIVQWVTEWGVPIGGGALVWILVSFVRASRRTTRRSTLGAIVALAGIALHDLVDFSLEMSGIAAVVALALGAVLGTTRGEAAPRPAARVPPRRAAWSVAAVAGVASIVGVAVLPGTEVRSLETSLRESLRTGATSSFREQLAWGLRLHPAEPAFTLLAGAYALRSGDPSAPRWLSRTMHLAPGWAAPHDLAARWLLAQGARDQAFLEIREAETRRPGSTRDLLCAEARSGLTFDQLARGAPRQRSPAPEDFFDRVGGCLPLDQPLGKAIDRHLATGRPTSPRWAVREVQRALRAEDATRALGLAERILAIYPNDPNLVIMHADSLSRLGRLDDAVDVIRRAENAGPVPDDLLARRARYEAQGGDAEAMRATVTRLRGRARGDGPLLARAELLRGDFELMLGNRGHAMRAYEEANRFDPGSDGLRRVAVLSEQMGSFRRAYQAYATLCAVRTNERSACVARDRLAARLER